jgi:hypothetical protein
MKAGAALGLLAGLGALNAIRGGREGTGKRFTGLMDMLDGGGAGASGDKFEGGGLLSALGNLFAKPLEAQDKVEEIAARTSARDILRPKLRPEGLLSEAQKEQIVMDQVVNPDVYNIGQGGEFAGVMTAPLLSRRLDGKDGNIAAGLTAAQKEDIVMSQPLTQSPEAKGILAQPSAMTQSADSLFAGKGTFSAADAPKVQSDPMGLLEPNVPPQGALQIPSAPNVMLESPRSANEDMTMLQKLMGSVPEGLGPLNTDEYRDYVLGGGRLPYGEYEKTTPEYRATQQLSQQYDTFYMMPIEEQMRLINERADILRREAPKPMPFTGPAF